MFQQWKVKSGKLEQDMFSVQKADGVEGDEIMFAF